jgi:signal transduction histidine kinase
MVDPLRADTQIDLTTDFAAQAAIALESTRRERRYRETQMALAHVNRVATMGQLTASITHEVNQPIAAARNNVSAALHFLDRNPPDLQEVREALACAAKDTDRAGAVVGRNACAHAECVDPDRPMRRVIGLRRLAERTAEAHARGFGSEAELAALLVREDPLEARLAHAAGLPFKRWQSSSLFRLGNAG